MDVRNFRYIVKSLFCITIFIFFGGILLNANENSCYVSMSIGSDNNIGNTVKNPLRTVNCAISKGFKTIYLKCGDVFYEEINLRNIRLDSYGYGAKPLFSGFKRINAENIWELVDTINFIWRIKLSETRNFSGFNFSAAYYNDIGLIHNFLTDEVFGHKVAFKTKSQLDESGLISNDNQAYSYLKDCFDFYQEDLEYLYWRLDENHNPNKTEGLEFACCGICIRVNRSSVRNIRIEGYHYGILRSETPTYDILVDNVDMDLIGGSLGLRNDKKGVNFVRSGNGIEFWISKEVYNIKVINCSFRRIFDCAVTLQGYSMINAQTLAKSTNIPTAYNVIFSHNTFINCRQVCEWFLYANYDGKPNGEEVPFFNCEFSKNVCIASGENLFSSGELRDAHILAGCTNMLIKDNIFYSGNYYMLRHQLVTFGPNLVYIERGKYLCANDMRTKMVYVPTKDTSTWMDRSIHTLEEATVAAIKMYRYYTGDKLSQFVIIENPDNAKRNLFYNFFLFGQGLSLKYKI